MDTISLDVSSRDVLRKKVKALRREGMTPLHLYGKGKPSRALQADSFTVGRVVEQVGHSVPLHLKMDGAKEQALVFIREVQYHPITNRVLHVDFYQVDAAERVSGSVPFVLTGEAPAVRIHRGVLMQTLHYLSVECLPMAMPERIDVDISHLEELEQGIRVSDLVTDAGVTILADPEDLIVRINSPRITEEGAGAPAEQSESSN